MTMTKEPQHQTSNHQTPSTIDSMSILFKLLDYMERIKDENNILRLQEILEELNQDDDINNYITLLSHHPAAVNDTEKLILNTRNTIIDQLKETSMCKGLHDAVTDLTRANSTSRNNKQPDSNDENTVNLEKQAVWFDWSVLTRYSASIWQHRVLIAVVVTAIGLVIAKNNSKDDDDALAAYQANRLN